jgi:uncharacterized phage-like protein YoqJ
MTQATTCCFTGHRPEYLPWGYDESDPRCLALKDRLAQALEGAYARGYRHFICGMALGSDLYFGEAVAALRRVHADITLESAIPYLAQASAWPPDQQARRARLLDQCTHEIVVQHHYGPGCLQRRNRYMVDRSSLVLAVYNGQGKGGTYTTLCYALSHQRTVTILEP